ncbi:hypothetical protein [Streptomyces benahoarensis]|uniref:Peptidase inhibitor family I36 n=1 Tax=Streptomyces benahoarensis TaxID=2595054 RepID=A0A553ZEI0_9ACTN|nr:hypothetical protein [Streptomyces benahoarensis]TSB21205.1 hypothetical protein FNJ62_19575 [Streptomyces benahoarensis]TSB39836.1 hypothetical protein FNZ23_15075 [Streptomyces benahoarensis]
MTMRVKNAVRRVTMGAAAVSLAILGSGTAHAATGTLDFYGPGVQKLTDPKDGQCYNVVVGDYGDKRVTNNTNKPIHWYAYDNCSGDEGHAVLPGATGVSSETWWPIVQIRSVKIG